MMYIFGFCGDYDKIVYGLKHSLTLVKKTDETQLLDLQQLVLEKSV